MRDLRQYKKLPIAVISLILLVYQITAVGFEQSKATEHATDNAYYADLGWRTSAGVANALEAALAVLEHDPHADIEFLVHGKDMRLFIDGATRRKPRIIDLSTRLAASGAKFRVCDHALSFKGVSLKDFPAHFDTVEYVPDRVNELKSKGFRDLHEPPK